MTKGKKIIISILIFLFLIGVGGYGTYELYVKPKYLTPLVSELENFLADEENVKEITKALEEIEDIEGIENIEIPQDISADSISIPQDQQKTETHSNANAETKETQDKKPPQDTKTDPAATDESSSDRSTNSAPHKPISKSEPKEVDEDSKIKDETSIQEEQTTTEESKTIEEPKLEESKTIKEPKSIEEPKVTENKPEETQVENKENTNSIADSIPVKSIGGKSIKELEEQVDTEDKMEGMRLLMKLDVSYLMGLSKNGVTKEEKQKVKEHMKERLTDEEYEKVKELIYKYIGLLK